MKRTQSCLWLIQIKRKREKKPQRHWSIFNISVTFNWIWFFFLFFFWASTFIPPSLFRISKYPLSNFIIYNTHAIVSLTNFCTHRYPITAFVFTSVHLLYIRLYVQFILSFHFNSFFFSFFFLFLFFILLLS